MFKRAAKRQKRSELEDKIGLAEGLRGAVSDSDESGSDSEGSEGSEDSENDSENGSDDGSENDSEDNDDEKIDDDDVDENDEEDSYSSASELEDITIHNALTSPLFSEYPHKRCAICPGRLFTADKFGNEHLKSKAHNRRINKFRQFIKDNNVDTDDDVHAYIDTYNEQQGSMPKQKSKKEEKRTNQAKIAKEKRLLRKLQAQKTLPVPLDEVEKKHVESDMNETGTQENMEAKEAKRVLRRERKKANKAKYADERRRLAVSEQDENKGKRGQNKDNAGKKDKKNKKGSVKTDSAGKADKKDKKEKKVKIDDKSSEKKEKNNDKNTTSESKKRKSKSLE
ncbi:hypothetical protein E3P92_03041 [Wallemia ichthyophaga]|uniref:Uncharacterized protein n=1 Tax=Wallemia ichthyophaga (strain EXF-994 / CBS 113033) TaxID=1299270 RepID=R9A9S8_WALI9|nr:uncharacterized protein J056_002645 [Wallemia ichthyophaga EXF-994]TIA79944.1 hypothetical protein E3P98_02995 [Wallemia ichthyophaga]EOQ98983.1 hypothetical protein J056_002645 [Wallemia ichthyophaga EXF-994]TIB11049.1 hypothetical protein E3P92_03041 [Wallemia ichthyophaga]TIB31590.1 hypothetical protein E3P84_02871 [Wallemia ichthyophaga]TIB40645.1 hypothetical protein E3P83_02792 [Wallemia ichthyophaga]